MGAQKFCSNIYNLQDIRDRGAEWKFTVTLEKISTHERTSSSFDKCFRQIPHTARRTWRSQRRFTSCETGLAGAKSGGSILSSASFNSSSKGYERVKFTGFQTPGSAANPNQNSRLAGQGDKTVIVAKTPLYRIYSEVGVQLTRTLVLILRRPLALLALSEPKGTLHSRHSCRR